MNIEEIETDRILAEKIYRIQEHITDTIKEYGDISQFKEDVLYVIYFLLERQSKTGQLTATQIQAKQMEYAVSKEKIKKDEEYIRLLKQIIELMTDYIVEPYNVRLNIARKSRRQAVIEYFTNKAMSEKPTKGEQRWI